MSRAPSWRDLAFGARNHTLCSLTIALIQKSRALNPEP